MDAAWVRGMAGASSVLHGVAQHYTGEDCLMGEVAGNAEGLTVLESSDNICSVVDARVDNREEAILRLGGRGLTQHSSDGALLLAAYERWGHGCVHHLYGDFSLAVWDARRKELFLARDVLGARSLCFAWWGGRFVFATESTQILGLPGFERCVNALAVADMLEGRTSSYSETPFCGITLLEPGHAMVVSRCGVRKWRYWRPLQSSTLRYTDDREYAEHFTELLAKSTRARMRGAEVVGLSLSGGLDSTLLASVAAPMVSELGLNQPSLKTFSYVFDEFTECDERRYIDPVIAAYSLDATFIPCDWAWTLRDLETWPVEHDVIWRNVFARLPMAVHAAAKRAGCGVVLDGLFGDGLFPRGRAPCWRALASLPHAAHRCSSRVLWRLLGDLRRAKKFLRGPSYAHPGLHIALKRQMRERRMDVSGSPLDAFLSPAWALERSEASRVASRRGLRVESPYYDRNLVEFMERLPADQIHRPGRNRWVQRNAMVERLPTINSERAGKTRVMPLMGEGLLRRERDTFLSILSRKRAVDAGYIDGTWLRSATRDDSALRANLTDLWRVCALELWLERLDASGPRRAALYVGT